LGFVAATQRMWIPTPPLSIALCESSLTFLDCHDAAPPSSSLVIPQLSKPSVASSRQQAALTRSGSVKAGTAAELSEEEVDRFAAMLGRLDKLAQAAKDGALACVHAVGAIVVLEGRVWASGYGLVPVEVLGMHLSVLYVPRGMGGDGGEGVDVVCWSLHALCKAGLAVCHHVRMSVVRFPAANVSLMVDAEQTYLQPAIDHCVLHLQRK
jgi:hypothetical protein